MADKTGSSPYDTSIVQRYRDMGDATFAPVNVTIARPADVNSSSGNVANAIATATLAAAAGKTTYITGFEVTGSGATAGAPALVTVAGVAGGTMTYVLPVVTGVTLANAPLIVAFPNPIPASALNTAIAVAVPALGVGNTNSAAVAHGFQI